MTSARETEPSGTSGWKDMLPIVRLFGKGRGESLRGDVIGGISACVVMIPSVIAYADLAGLPPAHGLYAALAAMLGYAVFASSRQVIAGPDAAITLLVVSAVAPLAGGDPARIAVLSAAMALIGGTIMLIAAQLRLAMIADFLSKPVLVGYMTGAALILVSTQLEKVFGVKLHEHDFFPVVGELARKLPETHVPTFALGIGFLALLGVLRRVAPRVPGALVVFVLGIAASALFHLEALGVKVVGDVPRGLPRPVLPVISGADLRDLFPGAIGIALLTFPDGILLARAFANKNGYDVRPEQELRALATANLAAGLFQGFPVGASQSRTTVNDAAGGRTQLASLVAAAALVLFLLLLTPLLRLLPMVALGAIVVFAGAQLVELDQHARLYRIARLSFVNALLVTLGVLVIGVVPGIVIGVMLSLIVLLGRLARPVDAVLQRVPETGSFHDLGDPSATETVPGLIAYRFYAPLVFANADHFMQRIRGLVAGCPNPVRCVLVDVQAVTEVDVTAAEMLLRLGAELDAQGIHLKFARANRPLREQIVRLGLGEHLDESTVFPSVHAAIEAFLREPSGAAPAGIDAVAARQQVR
jgi:sulfate permease, SulP family